MPVLRKDFDCKMFKMQEIGSSLYLQMWIQRTIKKMAIVAIKIRLMPVSPETNLEKIKKEAEKRINQLEAKVHSVEIEPIAFGLKSLVFTLIWPEIKNPDLLENAMKSIDEVESAEIIDVRRASF